MKFPCPHCGTTLEAAPEHEGQKANCAYCSGKFTIPVASADPLGNLDPGELLARGLVTMQPPAVEGWEPPDPEELQVLLPQYRIEALIGRGGMGAVYKGSQSRLGRSVAIKLLPAELAEDDGFVARFEREARTLAHLDHPGIIQVHDFGQTSEGHLYFVMEFVDGTDLFQMIHGPGLKPAEALEIITQVCDALQFAHTKGVVHRDIKPANILVTKEGRVKLADFGLARPMNAGHSGQITLTRVIMGTPEYMAPEQKRGEGDHRVDLYALGVMLYEMLCGRTPQGAWQPPSQRVQVDVRLDKVVIKAMQEEPERRYQQASEVKTDVETIRTTLRSPRAGKQQAQAAKSKPDAKRPRGMRLKPLALASVLLAMAAIGVWAALRPPNAKPAPTGPDAPMVSSTSTPATSLLTGEAALKAVRAALADWEKSPDWAKVGNRVQLDKEGKVRLELGGLNISNLAPFRGLGNVGFAHVYLGQNPISDLSPLKGLHIRSLGLTQTSIRNLSDLEGMPLRALSVNGMEQLADISGLNSLPDLEVLDLRHQISGIEDHTPILACRKLRKLMIGTHPKELAPLRTRPLENINDKSPSEYWARWDALRQMDASIDKLRTALQKAENGSFRPSADTVRYFGPGRLTVALQGAKLRNLEALRGHPIAQLELSSSEVTDISAVRDLPLERIYLGKGKVTDIRPLADCQALEMIELSPGVKDLDPLRKLPKLKYISYRWDPGNARPAQTAEEFWKDYPAVMPESEGRALAAQALADWMKLTEWKTEKFPEHSRLARDAGGWSLNLSQVPVTNLAPLSALKALPLKRVTFTGSGITDLTPLRGLQLTEIDLGESSPSLEPLRGMPIRSFRASNCKKPMTTLKGLEGAPLESIYLYASGIRDIEALRGGKTVRSASFKFCEDLRDLGPLRGHPVEWLECRSDHIKSFDALAGLPIRHLGAACPNLVDISGLRGAPLETLDISASIRLEDYSPLIECKGLKNLVIYDSYPASAGVLKSSGIPTINRVPAVDYWKQWDGAQQMRPVVDKLLAALEAAGSGPLHFGAYAVHNYGPGRITAALQKAKLQDLSVLRGYPVARIELAGSEVTDITAVSDLPLERIFLGGSAGKVTDIRPLADITTLEMIELSSGVTDVEPLRKLPKLKYISYRWDVAKGRPAQTAEEFWKEMDARK